jgi:DNA polymerase-3 subunit delta'
MPPDPTHPPPPKTFADLLGQDKAIDTLRAAMASGRVHHAWVFSGPAGVGKCTAAVAFAAMLLDPTLSPNLGGELDVDPSGHVRTLINAGTHPDLHVITKELAVYSDDRTVRNSKQITIPRDVIDTHLLGPIARAATVRSSSALMQKAFIVDEAELMDRSKTNATTQNAMLKTLEEPPAGSVIILVTANEDRLLPTIRSRCQRVPFRPLDDKSMATWFKRAAPEIGRTVDGVERQWIERFAAGSPGRALLAAQTGLYQWATTLEPLLREADQGKFPIALGGTMTKLVGGWAEQWVGDHKNASKEAANHAAVRHLATLLSERYRVRLRESTIKGDNATGERCAKSIERIIDTERHVATNVSMAMALEALAADLSV